MNVVSSQTNSLEAVAHALAGAEKLLVSTHENPDGDAIGSARAMELVLQHLGKDVVVYVPRAFVPREYEFIRPGRLVGESPADIDQRLMLCVDCGNESRLADDSMVRSAARSVNVDHHADNTRYGDLNYVRGHASCTTEILLDLVRELDVPLTADIATALYVGLVTDTGRFQYRNTTARAFAMAAELVDAGVSTSDVYSSIYGNISYGHIKLLARALENAQRYDGDRIIATHLTQEDFALAHAGDDASEGVVEYLRDVEGVLVAVLVRDIRDNPNLRKGSLRSTDEIVDVSIIARSYGGGGHKQAAGFSTDEPMDAIVERVQQHVREQLKG